MQVSTILSGSSQFIPTTPSIDGPPPVNCSWQHCRQLPIKSPAIASQYTAMSTSSINGPLPANCWQPCHQLPGKCPANARQLQATAWPANGRCSDFSITKITYVLLISKMLSDNILVLTNSTCHWSVILKYYEDHFLWTPYPLNAVLLSLALARAARIPECFVVYPLFFVS